MVVDPGRTDDYKFGICPMSKWLIVTVIQLGCVIGVLLP